MQLVVPTLFAGRGLDVTPALSAFIIYHGGHSMGLEKSLNEYFILLSVVYGAARGLYWGNTLTLPEYS